jgi:hypothetical protein
MFIFLISSYKFVPIRIEWSFKKKIKKGFLSILKHKTQIRKKKQTTIHVKTFLFLYTATFHHRHHQSYSRRRHSLFLILLPNPTIFFSLVCFWKRKTRIITPPWILRFRPLFSHLQPSSGLKATNCSLQEHYSNTKVINKKTHTV